MPRSSSGRAAISGCASNTIAHSAPRALAIARRTNARLHPAARTALPSPRPSQAVHRCTTRLTVLPGFLLCHGSHPLGRHLARCFAQAPNAVVDGGIKQCYRVSLHGRSIVMPVLGVKPNAPESRLCAWMKFPAFGPRSASLDADLRIDGDRERQEGGLRCKQRVHTWTVSRGELPSSNQRHGGFARRLLRLAPRCGDCGCRPAAAACGSQRIAAAGTGGIACFLALL